MKILLDTHIFLWLNEAPEKLSRQALGVCEDSANELYLSLVSPWEIQIKQQLGKLHCQSPLNILIETQCQQNGLRLLPIAMEHIYALANLPNHHNDPFDRLLIAQAKIEGMALLTMDEKILQYPVSTMG